MSSSYLQAAVPDAKTGEAIAIWAVEHPGVLSPVLVRRCELPSRFWQLSPVDLREVTDDRTAIQTAARRRARAIGPVSRSGGERADDQVSRPTARGLVSAHATAKPVFHRSG